MAASAALKVPALNDPETMLLVATAAAFAAVVMPPPVVVTPVAPPVIDGTTGTTTFAGPKPEANGIDPVDGAPIVSVSDLPAKAFAADKTPAAKATAPHLTMDSKQKPMQCLQQLLRL